MRALTINAETHVIKVHAVDTSGVGPGMLAFMQKAVGGYIERATELKNGDSIFVNEEGLLENPRFFFEVEGGHQPFAGNGVVVGGEDEDGETTNAKSEVEELKRLITFKTNEELAT